jgi:hypothetical protein
MYPVVWLTVHWDKVTGMFVSLWDNVTGFFSKYWKIVINGLTDFKDLLFLVIDDYILEPIKQLIPDEYLKKIQSIWESISDFFTSVYSSLTDNKFFKWLKGSNKEAAAVTPPTTTTIVNKEVAATTPPPAATTVNKETAATTPPPAMHEGGIVTPDGTPNMKSDEVTRILRIGEGVLDKDSMSTLSMKPVSPGFGGSQVPTMPNIAPNITMAPNNMDNSDLVDINAKQVELLKNLVRNTNPRTSGPKQLSGADASKVAPRPTGTRSMTAGTSYTSEGSWAYAGNANPATANANPSIP